MSKLAFLFAAMIVCTGVARANEDAILVALRAGLAEKPTAVKKTLLPDIYGVYFGANEPRAFVDGKLSILGNHATGYAFLSGPRRGQDVSPQDSQRMFREFIASIPKERLIAYRYGNGSREVFLFTAYDCPNCRQLEKELASQANSLNATVYLIPTALRYSTDPETKPVLRALLCAKDRNEAWKRLVMKEAVPKPGNCQENPDDYAFLSRAFPVRFPVSVPTAVTQDGKIYPLVLAKFDEIFKGR